MRRVSATALLLLAFTAPAGATNLLTKTVTTANTAATTTPLQVQTRAGPSSMLIQGKMAVGTGGSTISAWVQTSVDGGTTWVDIANFSWTTTPSTLLYNLSGATPVTTQYVPTDGTLAANTSKDGILGTQFRVKYTTTGTYSGGTVLSIDVRAGLVPQ